LLKNTYTRAHTSARTHTHTHTRARARTHACNISEYSLSFNLIIFRWLYMP